ncbi:Uncharacterized protein dnm_095710 [Desulfonema magnum]|uniref:Uncharacterized protein n=1 Tax=Desulfonema magnum TaxID=45655 RepID=A0A975BXH6_9BACT|nr:Uncharacterized protein dnm_095710 [Desulfonema magnum]
MLACFKNGQCIVHYAALLVCIYFSYYSFFCLSSGFFEIPS